jgi:hypothetical protein
LWSFLLLFCWMFLMPLACTCSSFSMPTTHRFVLLMESQNSCIFLSIILHSFLYVFICFFHYIYLFCLQVLKVCLLLVLVCWSGFHLYFLFDLRELFIYMVSFF